ncbi:DUF1990 domain-containing protein [Pseudoclavibacter sp. AY1F1]|uniref:DUF1990 family protein n=1 Tax=Pseudoclavibacter sp. AY1F1 TaxID=2080583 RepID=UPI000CE81F75|nr:DUF1990 domain-containing protein [Pseudoclavibacter sp. AY1F1]PPF42843.1 DUF1990 domain-containing protein [Pseudoclavibacter sp. AY1F1]
MSTPAPPALTQPHLNVWRPEEGRFRRFEKSVVLGEGDALWDRAAADVLLWRVKTRSGFEVHPSLVPAAVGARPTIVAGWGGVRILEPVEVVAVVEEADRVGFAYRTLPGHPVAGEEAFLVRRVDGRVEFTIRSLTRPAASGVWRALFPLLLVAQLVARWRYLRALR